MHRREKASHPSRTQRRALLAARAAVLSAMLALAGALSAQVTTNNRADTMPPRLRFVRVVGVLDAESGEGIANAELIDALTKRTALSSAGGVAALAFADTGASFIEVKKVGYVPDLVLVHHSVADTVPVTVVLRRLSDSQTLPKVVVTDSSPAFISPALRGFEERRRSGLGHFLGESELRASEHRKLADLLQSRVPGIVIQRGRGASGLASPRNTSLSAPRGSGAVTGPVCYPDAYLDGVRISHAGSAVNLDDYQVSDLAGVEFHNVATVPIQFNATGAGCGVLLLWTRER